MTDLTTVRKAAWETRRQKYGERGHAGNYSRSGIRPCSCGAFLMIVRLYREGTLSEGQAARALKIDRVTLRRMADHD